MTPWVKCLVVATAVLTGRVLAGSNPPSCGQGQNCPADSPCCSQYGVCGIGSYCLGGCDPRFSYSIESCMPAPQCENRTYTFENISHTLQDYTTYLGDSSQTDWTYSGYPLQYGENVLITMPANSAGTVLMSTKYIWYGSVSATFKTSRDQGVVSAFIFLSDVKDEIDYEFVGKDLTTVQTNIYWEAVPYYGNSANISNLSDTFENWHTYTVDWQPDQITWSVDGVVDRVKTRESTWNATSGLFNYPQTPARIQISVWPGGASDQAAGTIAWAGGPIDWNSQDIQQAGYYYMQLSKVSVQCAPPLPGTPTQGNGSVSYVYSSDASIFLNNTVILSDKGTLLDSELGSGTNVTAVPAGSATATVAPINPSVIAGGGSADGDRGSGSFGAGDSTSTDGTGFSQGAPNQGATFRPASSIVAGWSCVVGIFVGGMFTLL